LINRREINKLYKWVTLYDYVFYSKFWESFDKSL